MCCIPKIGEGEGCSVSGRNGKCGSSCEAGDTLSENTLSQNVCSNGGKCCLTVSCGTGTSQGSCTPDCNPSTNFYQADQNCENVVGQCCIPKPGKGEDCSVGDITGKCGPSCAAGETSSENVCSNGGKCCFTASCNIGGNLGKCTADCNLSENFYLEDDECTDFVGMCCIPKIGEGEGCSVSGRNGKCGSSCEAGDTLSENTLSQNVCSDGGKCCLTVQCGDGPTFGKCTADCDLISNSYVENDDCDDVIGRCCIPKPGDGEECPIGEKIGKCGSSCVVEETFSENVCSNDRKCCLEVTCSVNGNDGRCSRDCDLSTNIIGDDLGCENFGKCCIPKPVPGESCVTGEHTGFCASQCSDGQTFAENLCAGENKCCFEVECGDGKCTADCDLTSNSYVEHDDCSNVIGRCCIPKPGPGISCVTGGHSGICESQCVDIHTFAENICAEGNKCCIEVTCSVNGNDGRCSRDCDLSTNIIGDDLGCENFGKCCIPKPVPGESCVTGEHTGFCASQCSDGQTFAENLCAGENKCCFEVECGDGKCTADCDLTSNSYVEHDDCSNVIGRCCIPKPGPGISCVTGGHSGICESQCVDIHTFAENICAEGNKCCIEVTCSVNGNDGRCSRDCDLSTNIIGDDLGCENFGKCCIPKPVPGESCVTGEHTGFCASQCSDGQTFAENLCAGENKCCFEGELFELSTRPTLSSI
ncbi:Uncharacterised protein g2733 [Pycnogonum litorale]